MNTPMRVLIVEDSEDDSQLLLREIRGGGYAPEHQRVETEGAMREALANRPWDIVLADYVLPQFSALEALRVLRESGRDLPFIVVSGKIGEEVAVEAMKAGAHDYLIKGKLARLNVVIRREMDEACIRAERRKAERSYQALFEQMLSAFSVNEIVLDADGRPCDYRFLEVNRMFEEMTGLRRCDVLGKRVREVIPDIEPYWIERYGHTAQTGQPVQFEDYNAALGRYYEVRAFRIEPGKFAVVFNNTTERRRALEALRESEGRYHSLFENMINGFVFYKVVRDGDGNVIDVRYVDVNPAFERMMGLERVDVIGKTMIEVFPEVNRERIRIYGKVSAGGPSMLVERDRYDTGQQFEAFMYSPQPDHVAVIFQDITERKTAEIRQKARLDLLNGLHRANTVGECLPLICGAVLGAKLFGRALFLLGGPDGHITNCCACGFEKSVEKRLRGGHLPDPKNLKTVFSPKFQIDRANLIPAEKVAVAARLFQIVSAAPNGPDPDERWEHGEVLLVPIKIVTGMAEGWLWLDSPTTAQNSLAENIAYIEDIAGTVAFKIHQIRLNDELAAEQKALGEKNVALREILASIEVEKRDIKRQVAEVIEEVLLPAATKMVRKNNTLNPTYHRLLINNLKELAEASGSMLYNYSKLSPREQEICSFIKGGASSKEIAEALGIATVTVLKHREIIRKKLGITNKSVNLVSHLRNLHKEE